MTGFTHAIAGGNGKLVVKAFLSPNYVPGTSGWAVLKDGSAEFNDVTVRNGVIVGGTININSPPFELTMAGGFIQLGHTGEFSASEIQENSAGELTIKSGQTAINDQLAETTWVSGNVGVIASPLFQLLGRTALGVGHSLWLPPSGDPTGITDSASLSAALATGYAVHLTPGIYYLDSPLAIPDQGCLTGDDPSWGIPTGNYGAGSLPLQGAVIRAGSAFSGAALITMGGIGTTQHGGQRISGITLSGTGSPAGTHGIESIGFVGGVKMRDVVVWGNALIQDGLHIDNDGTPGHQADFWQVDSCKFSNCAGWGVSTVGLSDSWFTNCESTGNTLGGWTITGGSDSRWIGCRADSNGGVPGFSLTPTSAANVLSFIDCEANLNGTGWVFNGSTAATYMLTNPIAHDNTTAAYSYTAGASVRCDGGNFSVWVPIAPANGWTNSGVGPVAKYCWRGSSIEVIADLTAPTPISGAGTIIFSLPGAAALAHPQQLILTDITTRTAQAALNVGIAGAVTFFQGIGAIAAADRCFVHGFVSTDA